jgi:hypothetical protein
VSLEPVSRGELRTALAFFRGLPAFLRTRVDAAEGRRRLTSQMARRSETLASVVARSIFANPRSPYRALLDWAGLGPADVTALLRKEGVEGALGVLHANGVYVTLEEFKGLRPIKRSGLELHAHAEDFDNPFTARQYEARTGGSGGSARRILVDLDLLEHESAYHAGFFEAAGASRRPLAIWNPAPPGAVGIKNALIQAKLGRSPDRWFSQSRLSGTSVKHALFSAAAVITARASGARIPLPEYTPAGRVDRVVSWLARRRAKGTPGILITTPSACVRTCSTAIELEQDIAGTLFVLVGEPYTDGKAAVVAGAGCRAYSHYAMAEAGMIGLACQASDALDDVHLVGDKIATIQRDVGLSGNGHRIGALFHTTILPASPKVMLNVESGDYGVIEERECGCGGLPDEFRRHLHSIRSYEKLTSEGMNFMGGMLLDLVERVLPARFGGYPTDYQLVEREQNGLPRVGLVVSTAVGALDQEQLVASVLGFLRDRGHAEKMMADVWAQGGTLEVMRRDPHVTSGGKILPLQTLRD